MKSELTGFRQRWHLSVRAASASLPGYIARIRGMHRIRYP